MNISGKIGSIFWKGLLTLLPLYLTLYFIFWLIINIESTFSHPLRLILGQYYFPGMGLITAVIAIFILGLLLQMYITQYLNTLLNKFMSNLPMIGELYDSLQSIIKYLTTDSKPEGKEVVMVHFSEPKISMIGIVTRTNFEDAPEGIGQEDHISVYLPMSYQLGGFTVYVPRDSVTKVHLKPKAALKWALIAGIQEKNTPSS